MPTYQYRCSDCHKRFEIIRPYSEPGTQLPRCEHCGSTNTRRVITAVFTLTGSEGQQTSGQASGCGSCSPRSGANCSRCGR